MVVIISSSIWVNHGAFHPVGGCGRAVYHACYVVHIVVGVGVVHQRRLGGVGYLQRTQVAALAVVSVVGYVAVAVGHLGALFKLVVSYVAHVGILGAVFGPGYAFQLPARVVGVGERVAIGVGHDLMSKANLQTFCN